MLARLSKLACTDFLSGIYVSNLRSALTNYSVQLLACNSGGGRVILEISTVPKNKLLTSSSPSLVLMLELIR